MRAGYTIVIPNERYKYLSWFTVALGIVNMLLLSFWMFKTKQQISQTWVLLIGATLVMFGIREKLPKILFNPDKFPLRIIFYWSMIGWFYLNEYTIGLLILCTWVGSLFIKQKFIISILETEIILNNFPTKRIQWSDLQNVVAKDGLLTIDFNNNKLIHASILERESTIDNEAEFNEFCRQQLLKHEL